MVAHTVVKCVAIDTIVSKLETEAPAQFSNFTLQNKPYDCKTLFSLKNVAKTSAKIYKGQGWNSN